MQYHDLESETYRLLRSNRKAEAKLLVARHLPMLSEEDGCCGQLLMANVELLCSPLAVKSPLARVSSVLETEDLTPEIRVKASLLGAHIARVTEDLRLWFGLISQMEEIMSHIPQWRGRLLRTHAHYQEAAENDGLAEALHLDAREWHINNVGPFDERDRLCYLGLTLSDLSRLALKRGDLERAKRCFLEAQRFMPSNASQSIYVPICGARLALITGNLLEADTYLCEAENRLKMSWDDAADMQVQELRLRYLAATGRNDEMLILQRLLKRSIALSRNTAFLRQVEALEESTT